jgi:hypothetical protein
VGEKEEVTRLVLDTNVLVSALLFRSEASALFDASDLPNGVYTLKLEAGNASATGKMVLSR